ncbi:hypothetical protein Cgig2_007834 [Carnegiea gigantea]|uniref:Uncharacterized protein n=1 Tax=Carnegiea gigantea TaxID=171969 RepID=A0A9Q1GSW5_9CARY|nr:hypothetical protein Cgig2_007834 [Carnegiea gigantea]
MTRLEQPSKVEFTMASLWVKAYDAKIEADNYFCITVGVEGPQIYRYSGLLRSLPLILRGRNTELELMEEGRLVQAFRNKKKEGKLRKKLAFDDAPISLNIGKGKGKEKLKKEVSNMLNDEAELVVLGGKALKHKLDICTTAQDLAKVRVVAGE